MTVAPRISPRLARGTLPEGRLRLDEASLEARDLEQLVHQLRDPLAAITLELCLAEEMSTPPLEHALQRIGRNVAALDRLTSQLADVAAIGRGHLDLERRSTELRSLVSESLERTFAPRERARCSLRASAACLALVDAPRIERVLLTLVQAALQAAPRDTVVVIELEQTEGVATLSVCHGGVPLSPLQAATAFDRSQQGLAMFVARSIVEAHGGSASCTSSAPGGTRYAVQIPLRARDDRTRILIVDDHEGQLGALALLLRGEGFEVATASCGSTALTSARALDVDVVILDVELPDVLAAELAEQLRDSCPSLAFIVSSGHPRESAHVLDTLAASRGRFLPKPVDVDVLLAEIAAVT